MISGNKYGNRNVNFLNNQQVKQENQSNERSAFDDNSYEIVENEMEIVNHRN